ncbi:MAG: tRNA uridine-5-carboxymethylaminomethyl(34) synthesis GTPase MnmE [Pseudomonadota bacterium]
MDTIFASATATGRAGVAVIRLSGPQAFSVAEALSGALPAERTAALRRIMGPNEDYVDEGLILCFAGPKSYTGEDIVEFQVHGSVAVVQKLMNVLSGFEDLRIAEPGEFTRRALENGRLDLTQVEALADLIDAETEVQRVQSQRVLSGEFSGKIEGWRANLIRAAALLEASIDFADEEVPTDVSPEVRALIRGVVDDFDKEIAGSGVAERLREGFVVAIVGPPNVGKSTLLNALVGRDAAITSEIAGTTRDVIEVRMDLDGIPVTLIDTAGIRESEDVIEKLGIERALQRAEEADVRILLAGSMQDAEIEFRDGDLVRKPKADLSLADDGGVSGLTGLGIENLLSELKSTLADRVAGVSFASRERHRSALHLGRQELLDAYQKVDEGPEAYDLAAEHLRSAVRVLEILLGRIDVDNLLDEVFSSFCLGK